MSFNEDFAIKDVAVVESHARFVWEIMPDGSLSQKENSSKKGLNVIAIIGPGEMPLGHNRKIPRALLCEIGLWRSRPYNRTLHGPNFRHKYFVLTDNQYQLVGRLIWSKISELTEVKVGTWKNRTFNLPIWKLRYRKKNASTELREKRGEFPLGVRFCFDLRDHHLVNEAFWAELRLNQQLQRHIRGLSRYLSLCLRKYPRDGRNFIQFSRIKGGQTALEALVGTNVPQYILVEALLQLPSGKKYPHMEHLADAINWDRSPTIAHKRASRADTLDPQSRLGNIQLRIKREKGQNLVVEVYPPVPSFAPSSIGDKALEFGEDEELSLLS